MHIPLIVYTNVKLYNAVSFSVRLSRSVIFGNILLQEEERIVGFFLYVPMDFIGRAVPVQQLLLLP